MHQGGRALGTRGALQAQASPPGGRSSTSETLSSIRACTREAGHSAPAVPCRRICTRRLLHTCTPGAQDVSTAQPPRQQQALSTSCGGPSPQPQTVQPRDLTLRKISKRPPSSVHWCQRRSAGWGGCSQTAACTSCASYAASRWPSKRCQVSGTVLERAFSQGQCRHQRERRAGISASNVLA